VLWCVRFTAGNGIDQSTIASRLVLSPAQVSATVERLRARGWIAQQYLANDRRRHLWQLSAEGQQLIERLLAEVASLRFEVTEAVVPAPVTPPVRKEAA
jgi:DNA-binding MarR family transcriptional regulator